MNKIALSEEITGVKKMLLLLFNIFYLLDAVKTKNRNNS
jgi:hypothetical protein